MVLAYHAIFGSYGFWLPNDPRGSWSDFVGAWELLRFGKATKTAERCSLAQAPHDRALRERAKVAMKFSPVIFSRQQAMAVAAGFDRARGEAGYRIYACTIMPAHVHLVIGRHDGRRVERIVGHLKTRATQQLKTATLWPTNDQPVWGENTWKVFLNTIEDIEQAVRYVEENPVKEGKPAQHWPFVVPWNVY